MRGRHTADRFRPKHDSNCITIRRRTLFGAVFVLSASLLAVSSTYAFDFPDALISLGEPSIERDFSDRVASVDLEEAKGEGREKKFQRSSSTQPAAAAVHSAIRHPRVFPVLLPTGASLCSTPTPTATATATGSRPPAIVDDPAVAPAAPLEIATSPLPDVASNGAQATPTRIGAVVVVNMDSDRAEWAYVSRELAASAILSAVPGGIQRLSAVRGADIFPYDALLAGRLTRHSYTHIVGGRVRGSLSPGALGCLESHVRVWRRIVTENVTTAVFEDDVGLRESAAAFDAGLTRALAALPSDFDLFYFGNIIGADAEPFHAVYNVRMIMLCVMGALSRGCIVLNLCLAFLCACSVCAGRTLPHDGVPLRYICLCRYAPSRRRAARKNLSCLCAGAVHCLFGVLQRAR
jgi:hypothetical protein